MDEMSASAATIVFATKSSFNESPSLLLADASPEFESQDISVLIATSTEAIFLLLIFAASVLGNTLVFVIFYQRPALRSLSNRFVLNLALCDLLYSVLVIPYVTVAMVSEGGAVGVWWCRFTKVTTVLLALGCAFSTVLIAVDRYCAVMNPLHYNMTITRARCSCMIASVWLLALFLASLPVASLGCPEPFPLPPACDCWTTVAALVASSYRLGYSVLVSSLGFLLPLALLCWIYLCMYRAAKRSSVRARRRSNPLNPSAEIILQEALTVSSGECTPINAGGSGALLGHAHFQAFRKNFCRRRSSNASLSVVFFREEGRAAQTGLLVVATFALCWFPYFAFLLLEAHPEWKAVPTLGRILAQHLTFVGCALNPFVYVYRNRMVWKDARHVLHCRRSPYAPQQQRHQRKAGCHHRRLNNNKDGKQLLLLNRDVVCWRQASRSLLRVATDDRRSSDGSLPPSVTVAEVVSLEKLPGGRRSFRVSITNDDGDATSVQEPTITLVRDCLKVEVVHASSWSLPNQNLTAYLIGDPLLRTNVCFSDNYLTADTRLDDYLSAQRQENLNCHKNNNNISINNNNNDEDEDNNANNNNASVDNHLAVPACRNDNGAASHLGCPPGYAVVNRNRCASATSLIFRVAHPSHSYPGTTI